jgi:hypothetical protein
VAIVSATKPYTAWVIFCSDAAAGRARRIEFNGDTLRVGPVAEGLIARTRKRGPGGGKRQTVRLRRNHYSAASTQSRRAVGNVRPQRQRRRSRFSGRGHLGPAAATTARPAWASAYPPGCRRINHGRRLTTREIPFGYHGATGDGTPSRTGGRGLRLPAQGGAWQLRASRWPMVNSLAVEQLALNRAALVRIQVPQSLCRRLPGSLAWSQADDQGAEGGLGQVARLAQCDESIAELEVILNVQEPRRLATPGGSA